MFKKCVKCQETKDESNFNLDRLRPDGLFPYCKKCRSTSKKPVPSAGHKVCTRCKTEKPIDQFGKHARRKDGLNSWCKKCGKLASEDRRDKFPDKVKESRRLSKQGRKEVSQKWSRDNLDRGRWYAHRHRTKKSQNGGEYTIDEWQALCDHYGNKCLACGRQEPLTADHVIPVSKGGRNDISNIQPLCKSCNSSKGTRTIDYRGLS